MAKEKLKRGKQNHTSHLALHTSQTGITLIALVITIIVMMILVAVSVTVALNGGLFSTAKQAAEGTATKRDEELKLSSGQVEIDGKKYASYQDYLDNKEMIELPEGWSIAETKPEGWSENVTAITDGTNIIPLPNGFKLSTETTEDSIEEGLVLIDGANEFVWIPVTESASYAEDSFGPLTGTDTISTYVYDSQEELNYYYGMQEDGTTPYYNYSDFTYETDKTNVENSIKTYGGFYVGRYETTIDGNTIGVQQGKTVLTCATLLKEGKRSTGSRSEYYYRWWGLYKAQKDMYAENEAVGSLMISSKQYSAIVKFTGYGSAKRATDTYTTTPGLSGSAYSTDSTKYDVSKNIYDLAGNVFEFTISANGSNIRTLRGGFYFNENFPSGALQNSVMPGVFQDYYRFESYGLFKITPWVSLLTLLIMNLIRVCKKFCVI